MVQIPKAPPLTDELLRSHPDKDFLAERLLAGPLVNGRYLHWDDLRHRTPPDGLTLEQWWLGLKMARLSSRRNLPLVSKQGLPFHYVMPDPVIEMLHEVDSKAHGNIEVPEVVTNPDTRDRYIINSLIEEAITSSQIEGAATTRQVAAKMIRDGRRPRNKDEQMIMNNYMGMNYIREIQDHQLTPDRIFELHRILVEETLDDPTASGRLQTKSEERVAVWDNARRVPLHVPPPVEELGDRMDALCKFANESGDQFVHPVIRAIITHFMMAYDHPFVDGNGRVARALFYWSMLSQGYWLFEYVSISSILKKAPAQYGRAYLYTETDENDLTYFIISQLNVILRAIKALEKYVKEKISQVQYLEASIKKTSGFNHRQMTLLSHAVRHPGVSYTVLSHRRSHNISNGTARTDLLGLVDVGLLEVSRIGKKTLKFTVPADFEDRLDDLK